MKLSVLAVLAAVALADDERNTMETTTTVTKNEDNPKSTKEYGRFDHTTRVETTTHYNGKDGKDTSVNGAGPLSAGMGGAAVALAAIFL